MGCVDTGVGGRQRGLHAAGGWVVWVVWWRGSLYLRLHIALCATFEAREVHHPYPCGDLRGMAVLGERSWFAYT